MQEHAMCDVDSLSIAPPRLLLLPTLTSLLLSQTYNLFSYLLIPYLHILLWSNMRCMTWILFDCCWAEHLTYFPFSPLQSNINGILYSDVLCLVLVSHIVKPKRALNQPFLTRSKKKFKSSSDRENFCPASYFRLHTCFCGLQQPECWQTIQSQFCNLANVSVLC